MTLGDEPQDLPDADAAALDFAIGALGRDERLTAQLRLARDPAFRDEVERWQGLLGGLVDEVPPMAPPAALWDRIAADTAPVRPRPVAAAPAAPVSAWSSLGLWRGLTAASLAAAAVAAVIVVNRPAPDVQPLLVATLASPTGIAMLTATYDAARGAVILTPADKQPVDGRTPQLWVIEGSNPPRSLGTIDIGSPASHAIPAERLKGLKAGSTLAISLEPPGGSPTGAPTGPVVATGKLTGI